MKISKYQRNRIAEKSVSEPADKDYCLFFIKSPAVFVINGKERSFAGKTVIVFSNNTPRCCRCSEAAPIIFDSINFRMSTTELLYLTSLGIPLDTPIQLSESVVIQNTLSSLQTQSLYSDKYSADFADCSLRLIFMNISEQFRQSSSGINNGIPRYRELKKLREDIFSDPARDWNIDDVCREMNIGRTYFHRLYSKSFGCSFLQDVIESRITYASELLVTSSLSVNLVAEECGFESDSYFMRQFKKHTGYTPSDFRRCFSALKSGK